MEIKQIYNCIEATEGIIIYNFINIQTCSLRRWSFFHMFKIKYNTKQNYISNITEYNVPVYITWIQARSQTKFSDGAKQTFFFGGGGIIYKKNIVFLIFLLFLKGNALPSPCLGACVDMYLPINITIIIYNFLNLYVCWCSTMYT